MNRTLLPLGLVLSAALASCTPAMQSGTLPNLSDLVSARNASATLLDPSGMPAGTATFTAKADGVQIKVNVTGLKAGMHGMHIHENANCTDSTDASGNKVVFGAAGAHFDPTYSHKHGAPDALPSQGHGGDLPMISVAADGKGSADFFTNRLSLSGDNSVLSRSIIIHAAPDDYKTDPSGNSGARERCGVIAPPQNDG